VIFNVQPFTARRVLPPVPRVRRHLLLFAVVGLAAGQFPVHGQELIDPARPGADKLRRRIEEYLAVPAGSGLRCKVEPVDPWLNFAFRWQTGYRVRFPLRQFPEEGFPLRVAFRVTPEDGEPALFWDEFRVPPGKRTGDHSGRFSGGFFVGGGRYRVEWVMVGPRGRTCRKDWTFALKLKAGRRRVNGSLDSGAVAPIVLEWEEPARRRQRPYRIAVILHVAPLFPRSIQLTRFDQAFLTTLLLSLLENTPFQEAGVYAVSLEKQETIFETARLDTRSFQRLLEAMEEFELGTIGIDQYANPKGRIDFLAGLVNRAAASADPPDAIVFIGPNTRHSDKFPARRIERTGVRKPLFFYLHLDYFSWRFPWPDPIESLTKAQHGKVFGIRKPAHLAKAIREMERRIAARKQRAAAVFPVQTARSHSGAGNGGEPVQIHVPLFRDPEQMRWLDSPRALTLEARKPPRRPPRRPRNQGGLPGRTLSGRP